MAKDIGRLCGNDSATSANRRKAHDKLRDDILVALSRQRLGLFWANETGAAFRDGDMIHYGLPGSPDILGCVKGGYFIGVEVKTGSARIRDTQRRFRDALAVWDGVFVVARSESDALEAVSRLFKYGPTHAGID